MRRTPRFLVVALPVVLVVAALWLRPASSRPNSANGPTIEPTLPLTLELTALPSDTANGLPPRLEAVVDAGSDLEEVSLFLVLPDGLSADPGALDGGRPGALHSGEKRLYSVPMLARRAGSFPIKILASFRLPDGRVFQTQQGILWRNSVAAPEGRHHAGAYEWMAVPVEEPRP